MMRTLVAMDTQVTLYAPALSRSAEAQLAAAVTRVFAAAEARFSRFRPDSELSRLNRADGAFAASAPLLGALMRARAYAALTHGRFDPTIGGALLAAGYDRTFGELGGALVEGAGAARADEPPARARLADVTIDLAAGAVYRPPQVTLDLGGMIKGATVDEAALLLPPDAALDAGGDAVLRGDDPMADDDEGGWLVDIEDPRDPERAVATLRLRDQAVATSAANRRRWRIGQRWAHHLIDPRTGEPARTDLAQVTVVADRAERAEVLAKAAFIAGRVEGRRLLARQPGLGAVLVDAEGALEFVGTLEVVDVADVAAAPRGLATHARSAAGGWT